MEPVLKPMPRSRFTPQPAGGLALGDRDAELLVCLFQHQVMTRSQIQELYFGSVPRCNARLRQLFDHGFVTRTYPPVALWGAQAVYGLGKAAVPLVARRTETEETEVRRLMRNQTPTFLEHTVAIVQFSLQLRQSTAGQDATVERWLPEMLCRHEYEVRAAGGGAWREEVFKPDAFFRLAIQADGETVEYHNYFLEIDLGHTSSGQFLQKLLGHQRYLQTGLFSEMFGGETFQTLVVTTGPGRLRNLRALVEGSRSDLFWLATFEEVRQSGPLAPIWQAPFEEEPVGLLRGRGL